MHRQSDARQPQPGAYDFRDLHRPTEPAAIAAAIRRLQQQGLKPRDIADSLRLDLSAVLEALRGAA
jgi:hypothetical protein